VTVMIGGGKTVTSASEAFNEVPPCRDGDDRA
jgi:hypothetical protein